MDCREQESRDMSDSQIGDSQPPMSASEAATVIYRNFLPFNVPRMQPHFSPSPPSLVKDDPPRDPPKKGRGSRAPEWELNELKILVAGKKWE
jgi:hypothetical protein